MAGNQKERKHLEDDIKVHEQKISKLRDQMLQAKTNDQYRAFQNEIGYAKPRFGNRKIASWTSWERPSLWRTMPKRLKPL